MKFSVIHPSRGRPWKSYDTIQKWIEVSSGLIEKEIIISLDSNDPEIQNYMSIYQGQHTILVNNNRSCVDAINVAAKKANGQILIVVSDDTAPMYVWDTALLKELEGKSDYLLKTDDGIQDYICTMTVCDRKYYERDGFIYHPEFQHQFVDTYQTCVADIRGRLIFSKMKFPHLHYSHSSGKEMPDELHKRNDATWMRGQNTFIKLMKQFTPEEINRITNRSMRGFLKMHGVR